VAFISHSHLSPFPMHGPWAYPSVPHTNSHTHSHHYPQGLRLVPLPYPDWLLFHIASPALPQSTDSPPASHSMHFCSLSSSSLFHILSACRSSIRLGTATAQTSSPASYPAHLHPLMIVALLYEYQATMDALAHGRSTGVFVADPHTFPQADSVDTFFLTHITDDSSPPEVDMYTALGLGTVGFACVQPTPLAVDTCARPLTIVHLYHRWHVLQDSLDRRHRLIPISTVFATFSRGYSLPRANSVPCSWDLAHSVGLLWLFEWIGRQSWVLASS